MTERVGAASRRLVVLLAVAMAAGCATAPLPLMGAHPPAEGLRAYTLDRLTNAGASHMSGFVDADRSVAYTQSSGGGGLAVGVLFGPLGVMANVALIQRVTEQDLALLNGKVALRPPELFVEAARSRGVVVNSDVNAGPRATPFVLLAKVDDGSILVVPSLLVDGGTAPSAWRRRYEVQLAERRSIEALAALQAEEAGRLRLEVLGAYASMLDLVADEKPELLAQERKVLVKSKIASGPARVAIEMPGSIVREDAEVAWIRTPWSVAAFRKNNVDILPARP